MIFILNTNALYNKFRFVSITVSIILIFNFIIFKNSFFSTSYFFTLFNEIRTIDSNYYFFIKVINIISIIISYSFVSSSLYSKFFKEKKEIKNEIKEKNFGNLSLRLGIDLENDLPVTIPEKGLYQNILITGTIGTRKNFFCNVPFCRTIN